jgi:hypothetical protein
MEEPTTATSTSTIPVSNLAAPLVAPVMDVVAPRADMEPLADPANEPKSAMKPEEVSTVDRPAQAKPAANSPGKLIQEEINRENVKDAKPQLAKNQSQPGNGVTVAIIATVVIVLGLAALAVFAYMQTK